MKTQKYNRCNEEELYLIFCCPFLDILQSGIVVKINMSSILRTTIRCQEERPLLTSPFFELVKINAQIAMTKAILGSYLNAYVIQMQYFKFLVASSSGGNQQKSKNQFIVFANCPDGTTHSDRVIKWSLKDQGMNNSRWSNHCQSKIADCPVTISEIIENMVYMNRPDKLSVSRNYSFQLSLLSPQLQDQNRLSLFRISVDIVASLIHLQQVLVESPPLTALKMFRKTQPLNLRCPGEESQMNVDEK